jgi:glycosyltransferase involved in cell wall biosynthesis
VVNQEPLISVIVAVFNGEKTLQRCIDSVADQTYPHKELVIVDGGSTDGTVDILRTNSDKIAYWESEPDRGIYHAWNKALKHVRGDWICFLGSDDYFWKPDVLEQIKGHLIEAASAAIRVVYGQVAVVTEQDEVLIVAGKPWGNVQRRFLQMMTVPHQGVMHHRSLFELHGKFDDSFQIVGDYEFLLRELKTNRAEFVSNVIVAGMRRGGVSANPTNYIQSLKEFARARRKNKVRVMIPLQWIWSYVKAVGHILSIWLFGRKAHGRVADFYRTLTGQTRYWTK